MASETTTMNLSPKYYEDIYQRRCQGAISRLEVKRAEWDIKTYHKAYYLVPNQKGEMVQFETEYISHIDIPYQNYQFHPYKEDKNGKATFTAYQTQPAQRRARPGLFSSE